MASSAKEHVNIYKAKVEEKEQKKMAKERRKVKEARAKTELRKAKARHAEKKLISSKQSHAHHGHQPLVATRHNTHMHMAHHQHQPMTATH
ncbi:hypothetical protein D8674_042935 [Pyrus ussuriensis x Pyrus communis]|uniref:Uncharacterized protein n=1 Tax=Pyrus ussuriensis x Pyrus communis TaxID=2448454 RepID=A0A5N5HJP9_9ROSA|nr:hypothetical protein D8674_042935 [Pyrus ussuriensis x Pyrus communis]